MDLRIAISVLAVLLTFVGYFPYIINILKRKTKPHTFTWFVFTLSGTIAWGLQVEGGAGVGAWALLAACVVCFVIFVLGLVLGECEIVTLDIVFLVLSLLSLLLWLVVKQPVWSVALATFTEVSGFGPTVRKTWHRPYSETLFTYQVAAIRHALSIFALEQFNILTLLYPCAWVASNLLFSIMVILRRARIAEPQGENALI